MTISFEKEIQRVKRVTENKRYWFIRTYGGEAFDDYTKKGYVGLGLNNVPFKYIKDVENLKDVETQNFKRLQNFIDANTDYKKGEATKWAKQLYTFVHEISIGDTVVIPNKNSETLAFGTIMSDIYFIKNPGKIFHRDKEEHLPEKRFEVKWEKEIRRDDLQGDLKGLMASHQGITNADNYADFIEGAMESIFIRNDQMYLVLQMGKDEDINAFHLNRFFNGLTYFYNEFCREAGVEENEDLSVKIKLQSKGKTILKAVVYAGVIGIAGILALSNDTELKVEIGGVKVEGKSKGGLKSLTEFLDANQKRKIEYQKFKDSVEALQAKQNPDLNILKENSNGNLKKSRK